MKTLTKAMKIVICAIAFALAVTLCAVFTACGDDSSEHSLEKKSAVAATFFEGGSSEYYVCGDCGKYFSDADGKNEITEGSWVTPATGTTADVFDEFVMYDSGSEKGTKGIVCGLDTSANAGPSTYFGEADKNLDWDGSKTAISFTLDLSAMEKNDFTIWDLAFNKKAGDAYVNTAEYELRFGIAKTADGFTVCDLFVPGVTFNEDTDRAEILKSDKTFTGTTVDVTFEAEINDDNVLSYTISVGDVEMKGTGTFECEVTGFRCLWNAFMSGDGVEAYNFTKA